METKREVPEPDTEGPIRYPTIEVQLSGSDSNAGAIMGAVARAMRRAGIPQSEIDDYRRESTSGDYDNLIQTAMRWVDVH